MILKASTNWNLDDHGQWYEMITNMHETANMRLS